MALCSCFSCSSTSGEQPAQWFLCATVEGPSDPGSNASDTGAGSSAASNSNLAAIVAVTSAIGTTGNFTNDDINGLLSGEAWSTLNITFGFPSASTDYGNFYGDPAPDTGFQALTAGQQSVARYAFGLISEYSQITFTELTGSNAANATIRLAGSAHPSTSYAYYTNRPSF